MKQNSIKGRIAEYFAFTYFNWLIVVPFLIPWVLIRLALSPEQFQVWLLDSVFVSLFLGWWTVKIDNRFAPWFYKKMGWDKSKGESNRVRYAETSPKNDEVRYFINIKGLDLGKFPQLELMKKIDKLLELDQTHKCEKCGK